MWNYLRKFIDLIIENTVDQAKDWINLQIKKQKYAAFSASLICLCAKLSSIDGEVSYEEIFIFKKIFKYPKDEEKKIFKLFFLASENEYGYQFYAHKINKLFQDEEAIKEDVFEALVLIAMSDGIVKEEEKKFLEEVAKIFSLSPIILDRIYSLCGIIADDDWVIMGLQRNASKKEIREKYIRLAKKYHPDLLASRGVPYQAMIMAEKRMARINEAYNNLTKG